MKITIFKANNRSAEVRKILFKDNPYCCYCGVKTKLLEGFVASRETPAPPDMATTEHLHSRYAELPRLPNNEKMIACYRCNNLKQKRDEKVWRLLGQQPIPMGIYEKIAETLRNDLSLEVRN
ncbi:MAG: hypothetical protein PHN89_04815 [Candidatus Pacebacteria bacterium]|nr:hypothetical protein [Candidatus Paceibacterota bacterium]